MAEFDEPVSRPVEARPAPYDDPFAFFRGVIRGEIKMQPHDLSSLENNLLVVEILDAARESAATRRTISLPHQPSTIHVDR